MIDGGGGRCGFVGGDGFGLGWGGFLYICYLWWWRVPMVVVSDVGLWRRGGGSGNGG